MAQILDMTGGRKMGPAIRRLMEEALQKRRRAQNAQRFLSTPASGSTSPETASARPAQAGGAAETKANGAHAAAAATHCP
jgi:hypothetical protein